MNERQHIMKSEIVKELIEHIIPFWLSLKDEENGGFYGMLDYDLVLDKKAAKGCILNSRILWFFSAAYLALKDEKLLKAADHAYGFMTGSCIDNEFGGIYWSVSYDGSVLDDSKHTYNQAFAIYALSQYYLASGRTEAMALAIDLFEIIENKMRDDNGYLEAFNRDFTPATNEKLSENGVLAERTMNTALHVLEAYTGLYAALKSYDKAGNYLEKTAHKLIGILEIVNEKIYNPKLSRQEVFFDKDYNTLIDLHSYGHDIESSWLIDRALTTLAKDAPLEGMNEKISKMTMDMAGRVYDKAYNGRSFANECENGNVDDTCIWWVQAEAIVGFVNAYNKSGDDKYLLAAENIWDFIKNYIIDRREGSEWYWEVDPDGSPIRREIVEPWKCPYHNGRMCLEIMSMI